MKLRQHVNVSGRWYLRECLKAYGFVVLFGLATMWWLSFINAEQSKFDTFPLVKAFVLSGFYSLTIGGLFILGVSAIFPIVLTVFYFVRLNRGVRIFFYLAYELYAFSDPLMRVILEKPVEPSPEIVLAMCFLGTTTFFLMWHLDPLDSLTKE